MVELQMKILRPLKCVACLVSHSVSIATTPHQQDVWNMVLL